MSAQAHAGASHPVLNLDQYLPAQLAWIANKLSNGASQAYLAHFGVGIETWRLLVQLAHGPASAQNIARITGMDKASISRAFRRMQGAGLIQVEAVASEGRMRQARLTAAGRQLHDRILRVALERERVLLSALSSAEAGTLMALLQRLNAHLPAVEAATLDYLARSAAASTR